MATAEANKTATPAPAPAEAGKAAEEVVKVDLFEDDDEFEEFEIDQGTSLHQHKEEKLFSKFSEWDDKEEGKEALQQWEDDWDDDDINDDFSQQLRRELEGNAEKK